LVTNLNILFGYRCDIVDVIDVIALIYVLYIYLYSLLIF